MAWSWWPWSRRVSSWRSKPWWPPASMKSLPTTNLCELPLIANTVACKRLYEMNVVISDTAEYGNYLFANAAVPLREHFMPTLANGDLGASARAEGRAVDNLALLAASEATRNHPIEEDRPDPAWLHEGHEGGVLPSAVKPSS